MRGSCDGDGVCVLLTHEKTKKVLKSPSRFVVVPKSTTLPLTHALRRPILNIMSDNTIQIFKETTLCVLDDK